MRDLKQEADGLSNACLRTTPLLERDSCIFDYHPRKMSSVSSLSHNGEEPELIPSALIYQKSKEPESKIDIGPSNHHTRQSPVEPTPPPSSESNIAFADVPNISNRFAHFSSASILSKDFSPRGSTFDGLRAYSPRPFSSSDLTSLHPHPPNTPTQSLQDGEIYTIPEFDLSEKDFSELPNNDRKCKGKARDSQGSGHSRSLRREPLLDVNRRNNHQDTLRTRYSGEPPSHKDLASPAIGSATPSRDFPSGCQIPDVPSSPLIDLYGPFSEDTHPQQKQDESSVRYADSPTTSKRRIIVPPIVTRRLLSVDWEDLDLDSICAMNAQRLGYDILYAVRVRPSESLLVGEELQVPESFEIDLLASYGIATDSPLDSKFHLGVLRGTEPQFYVGPTIDGGPGSLESARLLPVEVEQGPPEGRRSGIVVGAYRTAGNIHFDEEPDEDGDLTKFVEFCASLVTVLSGKERKQEAKSNTAPATPTAGPAYTAHEIRQLGVGNHSFDAHHRNWI